MREAAAEAAEAEDHRQAHADVRRPHGVGQKAVLLRRYPTRSSLGEIEQRNEPQNLAKKKLRAFRLLPNFPGPGRNDFSGKL